MRTSYEGARGCGYRQGGGLYLVSGGVGQSCGLLPVEMTVCSCCGQGIKPARGFTWVDPDQLLPHHDDGTRHPGCVLNQPGLMGERAGLLWIGERFYATPREWIAEGYRMGFSRRISALPRGFEAGDTWVLVGHRKAVRGGYIDPDGNIYDSMNAALDSGQIAADIADHFLPGIFHLWLPERIEYVVKGDETTEELESFERRGIEPVRVVPVNAALEVMV